MPLHYSNTFFFIVNQVVYCKLLKPKLNVGKLICHDNLLQLLCAKLEYFL